MTRILNIWKAAGLAEGWHLLHFKKMTCSFMCFLMAMTWLLKTGINNHPPCLISCDYERITQGEFPQIRNMICWSITRENTFEFNNFFLSSEHLIVMMNIWGSTESPFSGTNLNFLWNQSLEISTFLSQKLDNQILLDVFEISSPILWSHW